MWNHIELYRITQNQWDHGVSFSPLGFGPYSWYFRLSTLLAYLPFILFHRCISSLVFSTSTSVATTTAISLWYDTLLFKWLVIAAIYIYCTSTCCFCSFSNSSHNIRLSYLMVYLQNHLRSCFVSFIAAWSYFVFSFFRCKPLLSIRTCSFQLLFFSIRLIHHVVVSVFFCFLHFLRYFRCYFYFLSSAGLIASFFCLHSFSVCFFLSPSIILFYCAGGSVMAQRMSRTIHMFSLPLITTLPC
jgi:hypothetical protein